MKNILVPVDFSEVSEAAARFAVDLAQQQGASVTFLNSAEINLFTDYHFALYSEKKVMETEAFSSIKLQMDRMVQEFKVAGVALSGKVSPFSLMEAIREEIDEKDVDLLVVGTNGSSGLEEFFIGSNTEKIVRQVKCPVISVPQTTSIDSIKKILVPLDLREIRDSFLQQVRFLQTMFDCRLEFIWVKTPHNVENEERVAEEMHALFENYGLVNYSFFIVRNVFPSDGIFMEVEDAKADMVAMATHARRGISHWLSGSLTEDTVNHVLVPVWSFKIDKNEKVLKLNAVTQAKGVPEYRKIDPIVIL